MKMERCNENKSANPTEYSWTPLLRQIFVCSGVTTYVFIYGLFFGAPTVFIPQLRKEANSTELNNMETISWLYSISSYGSLPWAIIFPIIAYRFGRKIPYVILWISTMLSVSLYYFSTNVTGLLISGFLQGTLLTTQIAISIMIFTEYTSPQYRGIFLTFKSATFYWGIWISNIIGTFFHWKNIGIVIFICCIYNSTILFWPESPYWLASKGHFEECAKSHRWLKGEDRNSEEELKVLILSQKEYLQRKQQSRKEKENNWAVKMYKTLKAKRFYKPLILSYLILCLFQFSGKLVYCEYIIDIIKKITVSESTAYRGMLILDSVTVFAMYVGVFLNKYLKRRTLLLVPSCIGVMFLFILSIYLYLIHLNALSENKYLTLLILTGFSISISCGPVIMTMCFSSELAPLQGRSLFVCIITLLNNSVMGTVLKIFPFILKHLMLHGAFLFYATMSSIFICILYKMLPETKGKTIQEIEKYFTHEETVLKEEVALINVKN